MLKLKYLPIVLLFCLAWLLTGCSGSMMINDWHGVSLRYKKSFIIQPRKGTVEIVKKSV